MAETKTEIIKPFDHERIKSHIIYNVDNQATHIYTAVAGAADNAPCLLTRYSYDGSSQRVTGSHEFDSNWDSAWDLTP